MCWCMGQQRTLQLVYMVNLGIRHNAILADYTKEQCRHEACTTHILYNWLDCEQPKAGLGMLVGMWYHKAVSMSIQKTDNVHESCWMPLLGICHKLYVVCALMFDSLHDYKCRWCMHVVLTNKSEPLGSNDQDNVGLQRQGDSCVQGYEASKILLFDLVQPGTRAWGGR